MRAPMIRSFIRLKQRSSVLLPHPEGPIKAVILLRGISIVISLSRQRRAVPDREPRVDSTIGSRAGGGVAAAGWLRGRRPSRRLLDSRL